MKLLLSTVTVLLLSINILSGQNTLSGKITDNNGEPLAFTNIIISHKIENGQEIALKAQLGTTSDFEGYYVITGIPDGKYKVSFVYIGFISESRQIDFNGTNRDLSMNVDLDEEAISLDEVVVTAQAKGQMAAINQQVNSLTIKNVVSSDRIQQNPDANAAEALGRLPGITVTRSGGEANGIVIRGMQGYNNITLNGIDVPVNLTSISQYALQNVEVFKSNTADMDASTPAGSVNLKLGVAPEENSTRILAQSGYNDLNNHFKNYKFNIALNRRYLDKKLGIMLNLTSESTDRSTEQLIASIGVGNQSEIEGEAIALQTNSLRLRDVDKTVKRNSAILTTDYRFSPSASIEWSNIATYTPGGSLNVDHIYSGGSGSSSFTISDNTGSESYNYSSIMTARHLLGRIKVDYTASVGYAHNSTDSRNVSIINVTAYESTLSVDQMQNLSHLEYVNLGSGDGSNSSIDDYKLTGGPHAQPGMNSKNTDTDNLNLDFRINMEYPYQFGDLISGNLKWGGRYKRQDYTKETFGITKSSHDFPFILMGETEVVREDGTLWNDEIDISSEYYTSDGHLLGSYLLDNGQFNDDFLGEGYSFGWYPNMDRINEVLDWWDDLTEYAYSRGEDYWQPIFRQIEHLRREDFTGNARNSSDHIIDHYAGYLMTEMKLGSKIDFVPGLRYEKYQYDMNAWNVREEIISRLQLTGEPVSANHTNEYFLPMVQLKYKPLNWLQGLFSYTETLRRPSVSQLGPWVYEDKINLTYNSGNPELKPEQWKSIDLGVAAHGSKIGLFSVTLFYKEVEDKIASSNWTRMSTDEETQLGSFQTGQRVDVSEIQNHPYTGQAKGIEVEWQTSFWYLPKPFSYFTLNLNYSYIDNKTTYVYTATRDSIIGYGRGDRPIYEQITYDELVEGPMTNQPSHLMNASLGFSLKKFETYLSYQYIGDIFLEKAMIPETDQFKTAFHRLDFQARYKLPVQGLEVLFNMANLTNTKEEKKLRGDDRATSIESYGWTADFGIRYRF